MSDVAVPSPKPGRYYYVYTAVLLLVLSFIGFKLFYMHGQAFPGRPLTPPIRTVVILHAISMSLWVLLMVIQPLLIVNRKHQIHRWLGMAGSWLAVGITVSGIQLALGAARVNPPELKLWGLAPHQFVAVPLCAIALFAGYVAIGVWKRRQPWIHREMMLLATLAATAAAIDRIPSIQALFANTIWGAMFGPFFPPIVIGAAFLLVKWAMTRSFDRIYTTAYAVMVAAGLITMKIAATPVWERAVQPLLHM